MKRGDRISAVILLAVCLYFQIRMKGFNPLSRLFPQVIIIILAGLALLLFILSFFKLKDTPVFGREVKYLIPVFSAVIMIAWVALVGLMGFLFSSIICFPLMVVLITSLQAKRMQLVKNCIIGLALIGVFYLLFSLVLGVQFPAGRLGII